MPGIAVAAAAADGSSADSLVASDSAGKATIRWTLGEKAGAQSITLRVDGVSPLKFTARVRAGAAANVAFVEPTPSAPAKKPQTAQVRVTDVYDNPVPDAPVAFAASPGSVRPARVMTDKNGLAATSWKMSRSVEHQTLTATLPKNAAKDVLEVIQRRSSATAAPPGSSGTSSTRTATRKVSSPPPAKIVPLVGTASR